MPIVLLEFSMLCVIGYCCWWFGRCSSQATASAEVARSLQEIQEVQETVEGLLRVLEEKAALIEERLKQRFDQLANIESETVRKAKSGGRAPFRPPLELRSTPRHEFPAALGTPSQDSIFDRALVLIEEGNDTRTVARATSLTFAEIETASRMKQLRTSEPEKIIHRSLDTPL